VIDFSEWTQGVELGRGLQADVSAFLQAHNRARTLAHARQVADEAVRVAQRFGADEVKAGQAGLLHDISVVIPGPHRLEAARQWGLAVLPEEETYPMLLHQQLSAVMAREIFGVQDEEVLSAVGCHTTLRPAAGRLDLVLFVADKIAWDQTGRPPYLDSLNAALVQSLAQAARVYLEYLREHLSGPFHPWARAALIELLD
jgi:predicted HD superfamily hydrolase involved in NAD metabolism